MSRAFRFTHNARPMDYRSGIRPMADARRAQWRKDRWLVPLIAALGVAVTLAFVAMGGGA